MHLPDCFGPNIWAKLALGELGCKRHFSYWVWLFGSNGVAAEAHTAKKTWKTKHNDPLPNKWRRGNAPLPTEFFLQYFFTVFFFPRTYREVRLGRETGDSADTSSSSVSPIHCRCLVQERRLSVMSGLISVNQSLLFYTSCPFIQKSPEGS